MITNKITELTVFESNTGERTVYARSHGQQSEIEELKNQKRWVDIFQARDSDPELNRLCEQVEIYYEITGKNT